MVPLVIFQRRLDDLAIPGGAAVALAIFLPYRAVRRLLAPRAKSERDYGFTVACSRKDPSSR